VNQQPATILIVDGDETSRKYISAVLQKEGYQAITASAGREGLISAWRDRPDVVIFDPALQDITGLEFVTRLRKDQRTATLPCVALSGQENLQEVSELMAAGCNEHLVKSGDAIPLLLQTLARLLDKDYTPTRRGKLFVFLSAKGGTGTSSLCANLAMCVGSSDRDKKVAVVDLVLPLGSIASIVGYTENINIVTVAMQRSDTIPPAYFKEKLPFIPGWYFHLLAGSPDPDTAIHLPSDRVAAILQMMSAAYDYIFVDLGRSLSRISLPIIQRADLLVLILGTDLATSMLTRTVWEYLKTLGVDPKKVFAIQNRSVGLEGLTRPEVEQMIGLPVRLTIPYMGGTFTFSNNRHEPIIANYANDAVGLALQEAASQMIALAEKQAK
jgi:CheY-like chemotaxis protein/MinD-like ATPase involved in chromosome partitioning or flagellar assembly